MLSKKDNFELIANASPVALFVHDGKRFLFCNQGAVDLVEESSTEDILAKPSILSYVHPDFEEMIRERTFKRLAGKELENDYEIKIITAKGQERWIELHAETSEFNGIKVLIGTATDISDLKKAKDDFQFLAESSSEFLKIKGSDKIYDLVISNLGEIAPEAFIVLNKWNPQERTLTVMRHCAGNSILKVIKKFGPNTFKNHSWHPIEKTLNCLSKGKLTEMDLSFLPSRTGKLTRETVMLLKKLSRVERYYTIGLVHDNSLFGSINIFLRKNSEKLNTNLIETFANTTAIALHRTKLEDELYKARIEAEFASRVKSQFLSNMSHEIRTPLNGIMGMIQILQETELDEEQRKFLNLGAESSKTLLMTIDDILDYSKIEAGKMILKNSNFLLKKKIESIMASFLPAAQKKGLKLNHTLSKELPDEIYGDELAVGRVLNNLISNALKFTSKGEVKLSVLCKKCFDKEIMIIFEISDTGIGVKEEERKLLFKRFSQLDNSHKKQFKGTGLGLAISKNLIEMMGGEISMKSTPGKGSIFSFYIISKHL